MSVYAYLVCPSRELILFLGKRLRNEEGQVFGFSVGRRMSGEDAELSAALWAFLADTAGEQVQVVLDSDPYFEVVAGFREIGADVAAEGVPLDEYVRSIASRGPG